MALDLVQLCACLSRQLILLIEFDCVVVLGKTLNGAVVVKDEDRALRSRRIAQIFQLLRQSRVALFLRIKALSTELSQIVMVHDHGMVMLRFVQPTLGASIVPIANL